MSEKEPRWPVGLKVVIESANDGQHNGKKGTLTAYDPIEYMGTKIDVPVFTLDDQTIIRGYECWWRPDDKNAGI